ncbi:hypothetical protein ACTJJ0_15730 [Chitinophaga sp. 22321]|uniref:Uncharacterized protein n=1 Tax=Chitinophaga hostae TaxID=2831022 RepID=A0ABS5J2U1_9BACT|nr:hypothetical protein [Chitinophaga hostae]MBS0029475.1 hypothetical protein [Chitinophaga hostae]
MAKVAIMEFDEDKRHFRFLQSLELSSIPTKGDKVVLDIDGIGYVFEVYDVHYADRERTDVNVIRRSTITNWNASGFPDISL